MKSLKLNQKNKQKKTRHTRKINVLIKQRKISLTVFGKSN